METGAAIRQHPMDAANESILLNFMQLLQAARTKLIIVEMRAQPREQAKTDKEEKVKSRKELRKEKKEAKKERIRHHFKNHPQQQTKNKQKVKSIHKKTQQKAKQVKQIKQQTKKVTPLRKKVAIESEDDKLIKIYESKLGVAEGKEKYGKMAKNFGMDDDIFDFLDGITKKVSYSMPDQQYNQESEAEEEDIDGNMQDMEQQEEIGSEQMDQENGDGLEAEGDAQFDEQYDRMFDNLDHIEEQMQEGDEKQQRQEQFQEYGPQQQEQIAQEEQKQEQPAQEQEQPKSRNQAYRIPFLQKAEEPESAQQKQVRRGMTGFFNKLSDGNILLTFREFVSIIQLHPRSLTVPIFCELFTKFNLLIEKPLFHILATNVALAAGLHRAFGNRLMGPLLHSLTSKFLALNSESEDEAQILDFGYSKRFQRLKNYATIVSLLYNYGSITGEFLESFVSWLSRALNPKTIELLYIVVQKSGVKVRQNDPSALKIIIGIVKEAINKYRAQHSSGDELQKVSFIQLELTEIKFNKKVQAADQRMAFLETFINKNVPKQIEKEKEVFTLKFQELAGVDTSRINWWQPEQQGIFRNQDEQAGGEGEGQFDMIAGEKQRLLELAKSFHMVTEVKRNIFLCLMDSKDYLEATQRILDLRIKNFQEVATVLVEVCTLQPTFNPYYPLVAAKIASVMQKFRLNLQYAIWDHLKLIHQYELRRTANLAKFAAKLISDPLANSSLSILRFFPDLSNIRAIDATFLNIFFAHFFKKVKREYLSKLVGKLREDNNRNVKEGIKEYLSEFEGEEAVKEKVKLCRRLLMIELDQGKAERGDDE